MADQAADSQLADPADCFAEVIGIDFEADVGAVDLEAVHTGQVRQAVGGALDLRRDRRAGEVPQLGERASLRHTSHPDDAQPVAQRFDLGQDVAGEQHRSALGLHLADAVLKHRLHQRVESRRRLVQQQELGVRRQGRHQSHLLPVPFRIGARLLRRVQLKTFEELVAPPQVEVAPQPAEEIDDLPAGQVRPQADLTGHIREPAMESHRVAPWVAPQQHDRPGVSPQQPEQHANGRGLARAVGAEKPVDLTGLDREVETIESARRSEGLDKT